MVHSICRSSVWAVLGILLALTNTAQADVEAPFDLKGEGGKVIGKARLRKTGDKYTVCIVPTGSNYCEPIRYSVSTFDGDGKRQVTYNDPHVFYRLSDAVDFLKTPDKLDAGVTQVLGSQPSVKPDLVTLSKGLKLAVRSSELNEVQAAFEVASPRSSQTERKKPAITEKPTTPAKEDANASSPASRGAIISMFDVRDSNGNLVTRGGLIREVSNGGLEYYTPCVFKTGFERDNGTCQPLHVTRGGDGATPVTRQRAVQQFADKDSALRFIADSEGLSRSIGLEIGKPGAKLSVDPGRARADLEKALATERADKAEAKIAQIEAKAKEDPKVKVAEELAAKLSRNEIDIAEKESRVRLVTEKCGTEEENVTACTDLRRRLKAIENLKSRAAKANADLKVVVDRCGYIDPSEEFSPKRKSIKKLLAVTKKDSTGAETTTCMGTAACVTKYIRNGTPLKDPVIEFYTEVGCKPNANGSCPSALKCYGDPEVKLNLRPVADENLGSPEAPESRAGSAH